MTKVAIIGAGIGGLSIAIKMQAHGIKTSVFEKARGFGGRMSVRREGPFAFDHGAQCFTARTAGFQNFIDNYYQQKIIQIWHGKVINLESNKPSTRRIWREQHLVATPYMNSLCKAMAENLDVHLNNEIASIKKHGPFWGLYNSEDVLVGEFDWVISTAPPVQTTNLLPMLYNIPRVHMQPCYALLIGCNTPWPHDWIAAKVQRSPIKWISVDSTKPGRNKNVTCLVAHSTSKWAAKHIDEDTLHIQNTLYNIVQQLIPLPKVPDYINLHRWRYAIVGNTNKNGPIIDTTQKLAATSDWSYTSRIEEVWLAAQELSAQIIASIT